MEVEAGNENMMFETGPFSFYGVMALSAPTLGETDEHTHITHTKQHITHTSHTGTAVCSYIKRLKSISYTLLRDERAVGGLCVCVCVILNTLLQGW